MVAKANEFVRELSVADVVTLGNLKGEQKTKFSGMLVRVQEVLDDGRFVVESVEPAIWKNNKPEKYWKFTVKRKYLS